MPTAQQQPLQRRALSVLDAAAILGVHPLRLRSAIARGELRAVRLGRRVLVPREALDDFLAGSSTAPDREEP